MNVLIISPCDLPVPAVKGGAVATLIETLIKENEKYEGYHFSVVSTYDLYAVEKSNKYSRTHFEWINIPQGILWIDNIFDKLNGSTSKTGKSKSYFRKIYVLMCLKRILKLNNYDYVIVENSGYLLKAFKSKKILQKYRNKLFYHLHNDIPSSADLNVLKYFKYILISDYLRKGVINHLGYDISARCYILKNGINIEKFNQELTENIKISLLKQLNIADNKKIIIFVGRIKPEKGLTYVLEAINQLDDRFVLLIIGSTNFGSNDISAYEKEVMKRSDELGNKVRFSGYIPNEDLWKYYKIADFAVLPSIWEEPAGLTILEAASSGIPVITTNKGGIPEYVQNTNIIMLNVTERLSFDIKKEIMFLLNHKNVYNCLKTQEFIASHYSESIFYKNFITIFEKGDTNEI